MSKVKGKSKKTGRREKRLQKERSRSKYFATLRKKIVLFDDPILKQVCDPVSFEDDLSYIDTMKKVLFATADGVGLAAPQIGMAKQALVWRDAVDSRDINCMINPEVLETSETTSFRLEGCLSFPGVYTYVSRPTKVKVKYQTTSGGSKTADFENDVCRIILHEIDHLHGICKVGDDWVSSQTRNVSKDTKNCDRKDQI